MTHEIRADEATTTGDQDIHRPDPPARESATKRAIVRIWSGPKLWFQSLLQRTFDPAARASTSAVRRTARSSPSTMPGMVGGTAKRFAETSRSASSVLLAKALV